MCASPRLAGLGLRSSSGSACLRCLLRRLLDRFDAFLREDFEGQGSRTWASCSGMAPVTGFGTPEAETFIQLREVT